MTSFQSASRYFVLAAAAVTAVSCASGGATAGGGAPQPQAPAVTVGPAPAPPTTNPPLAVGQTHSPRWWALDLERDGIRGISLDRAYAELLAGKTPRRSVIVAVLDGGTDPLHEDLRTVIWKHASETPGNARDDDSNGYVDDTAGWNFIGGADGRSVGKDTYEVVRLYARDSVRFAGRALSTFSGADLAAYQTYQAERAEVQGLRTDNQDQLMQVEQIGEALTYAIGILKPLVGTDSLTMARVAALSPTDRNGQQAQSIFMQLAEAGITPKVLADELERLRGALDFQLNPAFDPRPIVGDNYLDKSQRNYGNRDVKGPDAVHGTHVAGIIAAQRGNNLGVDGVAWGAQIMAVRAVPDGDERDKDVANAIRYAVDNGANVINMSFGKGWSPEKELVDAAVKYAESRGVLMVHGAGNDGENLAENDNYPNPFYAAGDTMRLWIEVGASSWEKGVDSVAAPFSNYGKVEVDVFAPGVDILSTTPDNGYEELSGTSMASPVVAGVAALIMGYFPELTAAQVKRIIMDSATKIADTVMRPGDGQPIAFSEMSRTGGIVNVYKAIQMATQMTGHGP